MKYHPDGRQPWSNTILMRDTLIKDHLDEWPPGEKPLYWKLSWWEITPLLWQLLWSLLLDISMQKTPDQGHPSWYTLCVWFMFLIWSLFRIWPWDEIQVPKPRFTIIAQWHSWEIPLFTDLFSRVSVFRANISWYHIPFTEHSEHTTTKTAYVHWHFVSYNCCFVTWISPDITLRGWLGSKHQLTN